MDINQFNNYNTLYEGRARDMQILNIFNKILEGQGIDTITGKTLKYTTGNIYTIRDIYNTTYTYNTIQNKYYITLEDGTVIEYNSLNAFIFSAKWLNN